MIIMVHLMKRRRMIKHKVITLLFILLISSCISTKEIDTANTINCAIERNDKINFSTNHQLSKNKIIHKFINSNIGLQILKIKTSQGYDFKQIVTLYHNLDNENFLTIIDEEGIKTTSIKTSDILNSINNLNEGSIVGVCKNNSSLKETVEYYLKIDGHIGFSVVLSSGNLKDFKDSKFSKELEIFNKFQ